VDRAAAGGPPWHELLHDGAAPALELLRPDPADAAESPPERADATTAHHVEAEEWGGGFEAAGSFRPLDAQAGRSFVAAAHAERELQDRR
jgi:hypothetical protein